MDLDATVTDLAAVGWVKNLPELGDIRVQVAAWENEAFNQLQQELIAAIPRSRRVGGRVKAKDMEAIHNRCIVATVLKGWDNVKLGGQIMPYSKEQAESMLVEQHPRYKTFRDGIIIAAQRVAAGETESEEALLGNSGTSSTGGETGAQTQSS